MPMFLWPVAAILVAHEERWRQRVLWERVRQLSSEMGVVFASPIAPIILQGSEETLLISKCVRTPDVLPGISFYAGGKTTELTALVWQAITESWFSCVRNSASDSSCERRQVTCCTFDSSSLNALA